jgi:4-amino-4-deoxy-L-arabinose transferase-like glycosyltransferase
MSASRPSRSAAIALAAVLALALGLRLLGIAEPWSGRGFKSAFGTHTTGAHARNFYEHGFSESGGMPYFSRVELADGALVRDWYAHHPALVALLSGVSMRVFGPHEWAITLPWVLCSLLSVALVARLARALWGEREQLLAALFMAVLPLSAWYGAIAWVDGAVISCYAFVALRYLAWQRGGSWRELALGASGVLVGGLFDWSMLLVLPGLGLHALATRGWRGALPALWLPAGGLAAVALHKLHMLAVLPRELVYADTSATVAWVRSMPVPLSEFVRLQLSYIARYLTPPLALALLAALAVQLRALVPGRREAGALLALALAPPGVLYIALAPARSFNHDFFFFLSLPWVALGLARLAALAHAGLRARLGRPGVVLGALALAVLAANCTRVVVQLWRAQRSDSIAQLAQAPWFAPALGDPRAVIAANTGVGLALGAYARAALLNGIDTPQELLELRERVLSRLGTGRRVLFLFDGRGLEAHGALRELLLQVAPSEQHLEGLQRTPPVAVELYDLSAWAAQAPSAPAVHSPAASAPAVQRPPR